MYDIHELEQQWELYRKKKLYPKLAIAGVSIVLIVTGFLLYKKNNELKIVAENNFTISHVKNNTDGNITKVPVLNNALVASNVVHEDTFSKTPDEKPYDKAGNVPVLEDVESLETNAAVSEYDTSDKHEKVKLDIKMTDASDVNAYKDIERRFYENGDVDDALFLARNYFEKNDFQKSEYWALQVNKINENLEEAWLLFAKSKYSLGKKNDAIKVLETYLEKKDSLSAKKLLKKYKGQ